MKNISTCFRPLLAFFVLALSTTASANSFNETNDPRNMDPHYNFSFDSLPMEGGVDAAHMPWSDNYWESDWAGISLRWNTFNEHQLDPDGNESLDKYSTFAYTPPTREQVKAMSKDALKKLSPAEKYDILMGRYDYPTVRAERDRTGPDMDDWQGICHGWVPASINHPEPNPAEATNTDGVVVPFGSTDVKALLSHYYAITAYDFARGQRRVIRMGESFQYLDQIDSFDLRKWVKVAKDVLVFNNSNDTSVDAESFNDAAECKKPENVAQYGSEEKCKNAYSFSGSVDNLRLVGQVGARPEGGRRSTSGLNDPNAGAFYVVMANQLGLKKRSFVGDINKRLNSEIWNQPIVAYKTQVDYDNGGGRRYRQIGLTTTLTYVSEIAQTWEPVVGTAKQRFMTITFSYTLEVDENGNITGGEWRTKFHPNFVWKHDKLEIRGYFQKVNDIYHPRFQ
jgi:hypothetical protein